MVPTFQPFHTSGHSHSKIVEESTSYCTTKNSDQHNLKWSKLFYYYFNLYRIQNSKMKALIDTTFFTKQSKYKILMLLSVPN